MGDRTPAPVPVDDRDAAVNVHQLRAGHWGRAESYLHRIGRRPTDTCAGCSDGDCPASRCLVCREEADSPAHVLLRCPCLAGTRASPSGLHPPAATGDERRRRRRGLGRRLPPPQGAPPGLWRGSLAAPRGSNNNNNCSSALSCCAVAAAPGTYLLIQRQSRLTGVSHVYTR